MLDTDICIYAINDRRTGIQDRFNRFAEHLCMSSISLAELYFGAEKSLRRAENINVIEQFTARLQVLPFSAKAAAHYGQIRAELTRGGKLSGPHDMLIGAHARAEGLVLVTNNTREFSRMSGLRVENWST